MGVAYWKVPFGFVHGWAEEKLEKYQDNPAQKYWKLLSLSLQARAWFIQMGTEPLL